MLHPSDTDTTVLWDPALGKYVMFTRMFREDRRWIGRAEADDFRRIVLVAVETAARVRRGGPGPVLADMTRKITGALDAV